MVAGGGGGGGRHTPLNGNDVLYCSGRGSIVSWLMCHHRCRSAIRVVSVKCY